MLSQNQQSLVLGDDHPGKALQQPHVVVMIFLEALEVVEVAEAAGVVDTTMRAAGVGKPQTADPLPRATSQPQPQLRSQRLLPPQRRMAGALSPSQRRIAVVRPELLPLKY